VEQSPYRRCVMRRNLRYLCASAFMVAMLVISAARPGLKIIPLLLMVLMDLITDLTTIASGLPMLVNTNNL
jgi:hypothetical protein